MTRGRPSGLTVVVDPLRVEASLWRRLRFEGQAGCREMLFDRYAALARAVVSGQWRWRRQRGAERGDLEQFAFEGLLQALDRYDPMIGAPFSAFARPRIAGSIADGMARMTDLDAQLSRRHRVQRERMRALGGGGGDDPVQRLSDLAVDLALGLMLEGTGLIEPEDGADRRATAYDSLVWRETHGALSRELDRLPDKEQVVIRQHYQVGLNFTTIAALLGLSRGRVSQLHGGAIARLRLVLGQR